MSALTGVNAAGSVGSVKASATGGSRSIALLGVSATGSVGSLKGVGATVTGVTATGSVGSVGTPRITIGLTGVTAVGTAGAVRYSWVPGESLKLRIPTPKIALVGTTGAIGDLAITLPTPTLSLAGRVPVSGTLSITLPTPKLAIAGMTGATGVLTLKLPAVQLSMAEGASLALKLPRPKIALAGTTGVVGNLQLRSPVPTLVLTGNVPVVGSLSLALPTPQIALSGDVGAAGRLGIQLRALALAMHGVTGVLGTLTLRVPVVRFTADAFWEATGVLHLTLPAMRLYATGGAPQTRTAGGSAPVANANTLAMHTERQALTQYTNFPFNSMCRFGGTYLGASDAGVFALTGSTDNGTIIDASARSGITDFGTSHIKRVDRIYMGYRSDGPLVMRVITDEGAQRDYLVPAPQPQFNNELHGNHVRMGRGVEARYWQFELRNMKGSNFSVDIMEMKPTKLRRRIGGRDA